MQCDLSVMRQEVVQVARSEIDAPEIGERIRALREAAGLSVADVASALDLKQFAVRENEAGRGLRQYLKLKELARVLGTTPNDILGVTDPSPSGDDLLDLMGAAIEAILIESGWSEDRAERAVEVAKTAALEERIQDVDRRLAARSIAVSLIRQGGPRK